MAPTIHTIDRNYDTIIVLKKPSNDFAPWVSPREATNTTKTDISDESKKKKKKGKQSKSAVIEDSPHAIEDSISSTSVPATLDRLAAASDPLESFSNAATQDDHKAPDLNEHAAAVIDEVDDGIYYNVSSRHLMLASPWFERALTNEGWSESGRSEGDGRFRISAEDWDAEAFLILLNAFHLRNKDIPRAISLEMLAKIAVLVDYYECDEAITLWSDMWVTDLKSQAAIPPMYCRDLVLWLWATWVFHEAKLFRKASIVAIKQCTEPVQTLGLPIPTRLTCAINSQRIEAIESIIDGVHALLYKYRSKDYICTENREHSFECGSFLLGALTKQLDDHCLLSPRPKAPFISFSFEDIRSEVGTMESPGWISRYTRYLHGCTLKAALDPIITHAQAAVIGLDMSAMKTEALASRP